MLTYQGFKRRPTLAKIRRRAVDVAVEVAEVAVVSEQVGLVPPLLVGSDVPQRNPCVHLKQSSLSD